MAKFKLTRHAVADIDGIAEYTLTEHGERQCARYLDDLEQTFGRLAQHPEMGHACDAVKPGLRRHENERHVVFYSRKPYGIRVLRVLHERMVPGLHSFVDDDEDDEE